MGSQKLFVILATLAAATVIDAAITWTNPANANDNVGSFAEDKATGVTTITFVAASANQAIVSYTITAQTVTGAFTIDNDGIVTLVTALDFEVTPSHELTIEATDDTGGTALTGSITATITVTNVAPAFSETSYAECMSDNSGEGKTVTTLTATEHGTPSVTYALGDGNTNTDFEVTTAGVIKVAVGKTLDVATTATYTIDAEADDGAMTSTVTVTITVGCGTAALITLSLVTMFVALVVSFQ